jgi:hypothetical protein
LGVANTPPPTEKLTISLIPSSNDVHVGDDLKITAEVSNSNGQQLGAGQCELDWKDSKKRPRGAAGDARQRCLISRL